MLLMFMVALPLFVRLTVWGALVVPTAIALNVRPPGARLPIAPLPTPLKLMMWGEPKPLSETEIVPEREPIVEGVNVTTSLQVLAAATLLLQSLLCAKSPVVAMDVIANPALPIFRNSTACDELVVPTAWAEYCKL